MKIERTKSIVLFLLVLLSLMLTWGLWTYQPQYDFKQATKNVNNVMIGEKRQFNEVIRPIQFIYHQGGQHFGLINDSKNNELYQLVMDLNVTEIENKAFSSSEQLTSFLQQPGFLEMIFPTAIPMELANFIMDSLKEEWEIQYFDRIVLNTNKDSALYFVSAKNDKVIKMNIDDSAIANIREKIKQANQVYPAYFSIKLGKGEQLYLPESQIILDQLTFSTQNISTNELKNALFTDPSRVKQYRLLNGEESYTDGTKALEITNNQNMMGFINPANSDILDMESAEMILKSIEFINDHSGWTDTFYLMDWDKNQQVVTFGLSIKGFPVFNLADQNRSTTIYQSWRDSEIYEYERSLINLRFVIESEKKQVILPSGRELLSYLARIKPTFNLEMLESAQIGYEFSKDEMNSTKITVVPRWFIKYAGKWEEIFIPSTVIDQGGKSFGME